MSEETHGRTPRLDLADQTLREWERTVLDSSPDDGIVLDRSAFYPGGGGQPPDHGVLLWQGVQTRIVGTRKGDDLYLMPAEGDPLPPVGTSVRGAVEDARRTALMRTHSGLHVLCGVVFRDFGALVTGGNMEPVEARMDFNLPEVPAGFKDRLEDAGQHRGRRRPARSTVRCCRATRRSRLPDIIRTQTNLIPRRRAGDPDRRHRRPRRAGRRRHARRLDRARSAGSRWSRSRARARPNRRVRVRLAD